MTVTLDCVRQIFRGLETDDGGAFFAKAPAAVRAYLNSAMGARLFEENPIVRTVASCGSFRARATHRVMMPLRSAVVTACVRSATSSLENMLLRCALIVSSESESA